MKLSFAVLLGGVLVVAGCSSSSSAPASDGAAGGASGGGGGAAGSSGAGDVKVRGQRYCELLLAQVGNGTVHVDVYNTFGLNDCPQAAWDAIDPQAIAKDAGVTQVIVNGPRYWTLDRFVSATFVDPTPRTLGGIEMRHAGSIDIPMAEVPTISTPYTEHTVERETVFAFEPGLAVYELVDPDGKIYDMQSFSAQKRMQTEADLAGLGDVLQLPTGWSFRSRVLDAELTVTAVNGLAVVVQDEFGNTYQQSQQ